MLLMKLLFFNFVKFAGYLAQVCLLTFAFVFHIVATQCKQASKEATNQSTKQRKQATNVNPSQNLQHKYIGKE